MRACTSNSSIRTFICLSAMMAYGTIATPAVRNVNAQSASKLAPVAGDHKIANTVERMELIVKTSRVLSLSDRIPRFQVHNEDVLGATPVSENQIQIFAKNPGTTQINLWDTQDKLYTIDVTIVADAREVEGILNSQLPLASLKVTPINESAIVSGFVTSVDDVDRAVAIIEQFYKVVINNIEVVGVQQVLLHTKIMEVSRTKLRQLGIDWSMANDNFGVLNGAGNVVSLAANVGDISPLNGGSNHRLSINGKFNSFVQALEEQKLIKLLAEPTVVATHGRPARFIVGGRVPNVVPGSNGQVQIQYEDYGTSIDFLPFVIGPGRIRLEVRPEVSEFDPTRAVVVGNLNVQAFTTRYVETAVEMQAGQTFAIAGLLQSRVESVVKRTPVLGNLPILGALFRKVESQRNEIELMIMVTPELVDAMNPNEVPRGGPGLNSDTPDDYELFMNGHIEVPNLKTDQCYQDGSVSGPGDEIYRDSDANYQGGQMMQGSDAIFQDGFSSNQSAGAGKLEVRSAPATSPSYARGPMPQRVAPPAAGFQGPHLIEPTETRVATANRGSAFNRASYNGRSESGALLPAGSITPTTGPQSVGGGVQIMYPIMR